MISNQTRTSLSDFLTKHFKTEANERRSMILKVDRAKPVAGDAGAAIGGGKRPIVWLSARRTPAAAAH
ncbi:unnamed protein product [Arctia plantaginis]|uniref:Uncharacterized protein n=1 Tax=Arctia plantaginis TaxID=874455 RepID=A0A8S0ZYK8_ARCPL|nr:unnamed protein product [Arctia plantaginis]